MLFSFPHRILKGFSNQASPDNNAFFLKVLSRFPKSHPLSFAYGSGVFQQSGNAGGMTDLIFTVRDAESWHKEHMKNYPDDYSGFARVILGPQGVANIQENRGAKVYFNTHVPWGPSGLLKYGVVSRKDLIRDLLDWETLYVSGRLHKPVKLMELTQSDPELNQAIRMNLKSALHTSLLLLPEVFLEEDLYLTLAGLSYTGDFRMIVGEDKNKVANIVEPQKERFRSLYAKHLNHLSDFVEKTSEESHIFHQDISQSGKHYHLSLLPRHLQWYLVRARNLRDGRRWDVEDVLRTAANDDEEEIASLIRMGLRSIVQRHSITQALKGIVSAGPLTSIKYSGAKLKKMIKSIQ
ncbi:phosphatidate cytidylyltransferase, mitochondrial [Lepeophtheirus salmonis]|uniref:phosphatidate cytidylyltransferase, mitochondrial n=1 Tax=Lepeophtheirus salmonis TaxID=72036 RepID=UPI001AEB39B5|nr:phosphatidate cytidylyltransferase, mitochondrial-like [Lepeophtheirus salmonis]